MEVKYDWREKKFYVQEKMSSGQTFYLEAMEYWRNPKTKIRWFNLALAVYNKRRQAAGNEANFRITGKNPLETVATGLKALRLLEEEIKERYPGKAILTTTWTNAKRRDAYAAVLLRRGFYWSNSEAEDRCRKVLRKDL